MPRNIGPYAEDSDIPPPPDGSGVVAVGAAPAAASPADAPASADVPPPPDGSGIAPDAGSDMEGGFADELPAQPASHMSPEAETKYRHLLQTADAGTLQTFLQRQGFASDPKALQTYVANRDKGVPSPTDFDYGLNKVETTTGGALARGAAQGATFGFADELSGLYGGAKEALTGGDFGTGYNRSVDESRANLGADEQDHWLASLTGNLAGGLAIPLGLEKAGVTASVRAVGAAARDAAIAEGVAPAAADRIAARAITHRLAAEGAAYGGAYGAGSSDGTPGQRLVEAGTGAAGGALLGGLVLPAAGKALGAAGRGVRGAVDSATGSFTRAGAERKASAVLADNAMRPIEDIVNDIAYRPKAVPGSAPTLGEVAGDSGLAGLQRGVANSSPDAAGKIGERHAQNAMARTAYADEALGNGNPQAIQDVASGRVQAAEGASRAQQAERAAAAERRLAAGRETAAAGQAEAEGSVTTARAAVGPVADRTATGSTARQTFERAHAQAKARTNAAYNVPALLDNEPVSLRPSELADHILPTFGGDSDVGAFKQEVVQASKSALPQRPQSLTQFVRSRGGVSINDMGADDLRHSGLDSRNLPGFLNKNGKPADDQLEAAIETGFVPENTTLSEFLGHLDDENRGLSRLVRPEDANAEQDYHAALSNRQHWDKELGQRNLDPLKMTDAQWRDLHQDMSGRESQSRTLDDLDRERTPGEIMGPFQKSIDSLRQQYFGDGATSVPADAAAFVKDVTNADTVGIRTLEGWERRANDLAARAPDRTTAAYLRGVGRVIGGKADEAGGPGRRAALLTARSARREQGRVFETGDIAKTFANDRYGNPVVGDTTVPTRLARPGAAGGDTADQLIAAVGPERAEQTMREELRRVVDEGGVTSEQQARSVATRYGEAAKRFPALQSDLDALVGHTARLDAAASATRDADRATTTAAEKAHINELSAAEQAIKASPLSRIADPSQDPASFVGGLLRRSDAGRTLKRLADGVSDNPEAVAGLRRSFGQYIVEAGSGVRNTAAGDDIPALAKTRKAISTIVTRAGDLLTPQQKIALQRVGRELKATNFAMNAGRPSGSDTAQNQSYKAALHFLPAAIPHIGGAKAVLSVLASHFTNREQVQHLITQAILDPDFAATLLKRPTASHLSAARAQLVGRKALVASTLIAQQPEQATARQMTGAQ